MFNVRFLSLLPSFIRIYSVILKYLREDFGELRLILFFNKTCW